MNAKRKKIEDLIYKVFNALDPTGDNTKYYKDLFGKMDDSKFNKFMENFFKDEDENFYLEIEPYKREPTQKEIKEAADILGVPLYEHVIMPFANPGGPPVVTPTPVPVGYIHVKRLQQMVAKKNSMSIHIDKRQGKTGQVIGEDKNGRISDMEAISLVTMGADKILKEYMHSRADNLTAKNEMLNKIKGDGFVSIDEVSSKNSDKVALSTMDVFFTSALIKTDLVTGSLATHRTMSNPGGKDVSSVGSKYVKKE